MAYVEQRIRTFGAGGARRLAGMVTNGPCSPQGAEFIAIVRLVLATVGLNGLAPHEARAQALDGQNMPLPFLSDLPSVAWP